MWNGDDFMKLAAWMMALLILFICIQGAEGTREVIDSRGVAVEVPENIERAVTISDGLIEGTMLVLGVEDKIVGIGSTCLPKLWNYTYESVSGQPFEYKDGANPVRYLYPRLRELPVVANGDSAPNFESIAKLR
jgi:iron complex transport system substrate-binding protein